MSSRSKFWPFKRTRTLRKDAFQRRQTKYIAVHCRHCRSQPWDIQLYPSYEQLLQVEQHKNMYRAMLHAGKFFNVNLQNLYPGTRSRNTAAERCRRCECIRRGQSRQHFTMRQWQPAAKAAQHPLQVLHAPNCPFLYSFTANNPRVRTAAERQPPVPSRSRGRHQARA